MNKYWRIGKKSKHGKNRKLGGGSEMHELAWHNIYEKMKAVGLVKVALLLVLGICLLLLSFPQKKTTKKVEKKEELTANALEQYTNHLEERVAEALMEVEGIGKVKVMITLKNGGEEVVLKDYPSKEETVVEQGQAGVKKESKNKSVEEKTVMESVGNGQEEPYITKSNQPEIEGVIVVAQGAGRMQVVNDINEAIVALFSVPPHKIKVMKMK